MYRLILIKCIQLAMQLQRNAQFVNPWSTQMFETDANLAVHRDKPPSLSLPISLSLYIYIHVNLLSLIRTHIFELLARCIYDKKDCLEFSHMIK